jgi:diguanylate cyclase (GGDEF)-like protein
VGDELRRACRPHDVVGRLGGEEFAVLFPHTPLDVAADIAERIRQRLRNVVIRVGDTDILATASFGVAAFIAGDAYEDLFARADDGLYRAKRTGRDRVVVIEDRNPGSGARVARTCAA